MLKTAVRNTRKLIRATSQAENIRLGRFFTKRDTAARMAEMVRPATAETVCVLDPGAGTGILSAALCERLCAEGTVREIHLVLYENCAAYLPILRRNLEAMRKKCRRLYGVKLIADVREENYVLAMKEDYQISFFGREPERFEYIVMNPPADRVAADSPEALAAPDVCTGGGELTCLFVAMSAHALAEGGQMVMLLPTVFATAVQMGKARSELLSLTVPTAIHLFSDPRRHTLKKTMLLAVRRGYAGEGDAVTVSVSDDAGTPEHTRIYEPLPYTTVVRGDDGTLLLLGDEEEMAVVRYMQSLPYSFASYGLKMKTGLTLLARYKDHLYDQPVQGSVPLIHPGSLSGGRVLFPARLRRQYLVPVIPSLTQRNRNMLLIKRVPAKGDPRRLMCGVYLASQLPGRPLISTHNKLCYVDTMRDGEMDAAFLYGLYAFLTSSVCDRYIRILSKSKQINAKELSDLPLPAPDVLRRLGAKLISVRVYTPAYCDRVVADVMQPPVK